MKEKSKTSYSCSNCKANHIQWYGKCHFCNSWNTIEEKVVNTKSALDIWFDFQIKYELDNGSCKCMNCDAPIRHQLLSKDTWVRRGTIAHILPKSKFPEIATNLHNYMTLCLSCHSMYDSSWSNAEKMKVFSIAKTRFKLFRNLITSPLTKIEKYFE